MRKKIIIESLLLLGLGSLTSLSLPPYNIFIINFFTFSIFFSFLYKKLKQPINKFFYLYYGWLFGFGYFLTNIYWITISLTFDKNVGFLIPVALILIPSFLAIFYALVTLFFFFYHPKNILSAFFLFSFLFGITEFIRGNILTGFPWNLIIYSFSKNINFINIISVIGTYSLNLILISLFTLPALYIFKKSKKVIFVGTFLLILPIIFIAFGLIQKKEFSESKIEQNPYAIRVIGSNISLDRFYDNTQTEEVINELILISSPEKEKKIFFVWPEGIIPNIYQDELNSYSKIMNKYFNENHLIGLGISSRKIENGNYKIYNSFSIFDNDLNLIDNYNKIKLVPFGEFIPLENFFDKIGFKLITNNIGSFTKGDKRKIIELISNDKNLRFLPLICYEIIYSGNLTNNFDFDFIINISEDGWFGESIGPKQHFSHSIFRAIESGKYVIRSSNNGMAAIINPLGQIEKKIDYGESGYIDFENRKVINETIFSIFGNSIFMILILLYIFLIFSFNRVKNE